MVIITQDKKKIINFDKVEAIIVIRDGDIAITYDGTMSTTIATYQTEKRAKQILEDIHRIYELSELYKYSNDEVREQITEGLDKVNQTVFRYEMPEV